MAPALTFLPVGPLHVCMHLKVIGGINDQSRIIWAGGVFPERVTVFLSLLAGYAVLSRKSRTTRRNPSGFSSITM
jgi:hypothetical protein